MTVRCFACDTLIDADSTEDVLDAFVVYGHEKHAWPYSQEAIRNYARNYAEARERRTRSAERLFEIGEVTVHPVTEGRVSDWLQFFDHDAFRAIPIGPRVIASNLIVPATPERPAGIRVR